MNVFQQIGNRAWIFESGSDYVHNLTQTPMGGLGILAIKFEANGDISFPSTMGFLPNEMRFWSFDEQTQSVLLMDQNHAQTLAVSLPRLDGPVILRMDFHDGSTGFLYSHPAIESRVVNVKQLFEADMNKVYVTDEVADTTFFEAFLTENGAARPSIHQALISGYSVKQLEAGVKDQAGLEALQNYLLTHTAIDVVVVQLGNAVPTSELLTSVQSTNVYVDQNNEFLGGSRTDILNLCSYALLASYHAELMGHEFDFKESLPELLQSFSVKKLH
ncbi:hypothetical protein [Furfurilactobacillus siliginis]|uniref:Uncharacterized protein n=1 Tax=Furfurilactobacillus siliginis TaxID=348151 RepID=A0A0R2KX49_9LACO|nr:hypothetical protein [Furfurilactobacillus siliginis]KRN94107.1 hypothetical protein IV55_GL000620 [Furfurilactobacillus siliginis]GEK29089.1 hypothetical protein LSI01_14000 [Furfurilactobacillus siliginis]